MKNGCLLSRWSLHRMSVGNNPSQEEGYPQGIIPACDGIRPRKDPFSKPGTKPRKG